MQPWDVYLIYNSVKLHFESDSYDAIKYSFKTSATQKSFFQRKDKYFFAKLAKKYPDKQILIDFLVANFASLDTGKCWAGNLVEQSADDNYKFYLRRIESMSYFFGDQVDRLVEQCKGSGLSFDDLFKSENGAHPRIATLVMDKTIELETLVVLDIMVGFMKRSKITETILWPEFSKKVLKFKPFLKQKVDIKKLRQIVLLGFTNRE